MKRTVVTDAKKSTAPRARVRAVPKVVKKTVVAKASQKIRLVKKKVTKSSSLKVAAKIEQPKTIKITNATRRVSRNVQQRPALALMVRSAIERRLVIPFRLPLNNQHLVSNVARYAGTAFVVLGAILTLYNVNAANSFFSGPLSLQTAQTISGSDCVSGTVGCTPTTSSNTNTTPTPDFKVESPTTTLTGMVPVNVTVSLATSITLFAQSTDSNQRYQIGTMSKVSDLAWRTYWQTSNFLDGNYRLLVYITNQYGSYMAEDLYVYTILNHPADTTGSAGTTTSGGTTPTTTTTTATSTDTTISTINTQTPTMKVDIGESQPVSDWVSIRTYIDGASAVRLFLKPKDSVTTFTPLGYATFSGNNEWRFDWKSTSVSNGMYYLKVQAILKDGTPVPKTISLDIQNKLSDEQTITPTTTAETQQISDALTPKIGLEIAGKSPLAGAVDMYVNVPLAQYVELYAVPSTALTPRFVGTAYKVSDTAWKYRFDTEMMPNGAYALFAKVRTSYGESVSASVPFSIKNELKIEPTPEQTTYTDSLKDSYTEAESTTDQIPPPPVFTPRDATHVDVEVPTVDGGTEALQTSVKTILDEFALRTQELVDAYARAIRVGDTKKRDATLVQMDMLESEIVTSIASNEVGAEFLQQIREYLKSTSADLRERAERSDVIIKERIGDAVMKDSDKDGVTDFDEVNLYSTNPFAADTDSDGFTDGAEILSGHNPNDSKPEVTVQYESPKDSGIVREDLLSVASIATLTSSLETGTTKTPSAILTGTGLPNSYVTLYIFSAPIMVTVKTDAQGGWSYIFDKELDNGTHDVYVGITDNAGKIVAKSNPLPFIKTAEAFTPVDASAAVQVTTPDNLSLLSSQMLLAIGSVAVVALGLVLILLGLHVRPRETPLELAA